MEFFSLRDVDKQCLKELLDIPYKLVCDSCGIELKWTDEIHLLPPSVAYPKGKNKDNVIVLCGGACLIDYCSKAENEDLEAEIFSVLNRFLGKLQTKDLSIIQKDGIYPLQNGERLQVLDSAIGRIAKEIAQDCDLKVIE